nr:cupin domain-containing protein [Legionella jordanis]
MCTMTLTKRFSLIFLLAFGINATLKASSLEMEQLLKTTSSWNGATLPSITPGQTEFSILRFKIPPGSKTSIHLHPMNGAGYILSGELTMYATDDPHGSFADKSKVKKITLKTGQTWTETVNTWHYGENNSNKDVDLILFFVGPVKTPIGLSLNG